MNLWANIRQWRYPVEFRIAKPVWCGDLVRALDQLGCAIKESTVSGPTQTKEQQTQTQLLVDIGTGLWRLRQKMVKPGTTQPLDEMRRPYRHLESVWDALIQAGAEIQDHTDKPFDAGMSLKVVAFQPTPGIGRERVIETIKPTIYFKGKAIQMGEVIVGRPDGAKGAPHSEGQAQSG